MVLPGLESQWERMQEADLSPVASKCWKGAEGASGLLLHAAAWSGERCPKQLLLENRRRPEMMEAKGASSMP